MNTYQCPDCDHVMRSQYLPIRCGNKFCHGGVSNLKLVSSKPHKEEDMDRLNALQKIIDADEARVVCRWAYTGVGFVLHRALHDGEGHTSVRAAIDEFLADKGPRRPLDDPMYNTLVRKNHLRTIKPAL